MDALPSAAPDHPCLTVVKSKGSIKVRNTTQICGVGPRNVFHTYNNSIDTVVRAIKERVYYIPNPDKTGFVPVPEIDPAVFEVKLETFKRAFKAELFHAQPWSREKFSGTYTAQKLQRYLIATEKLNREGLRRRDGWWKTFLKFEAYSFTDKTDPAPRGINPRHDKYLVELGRYLKPIEKRIYKAINKIFGFVAIFKCLNNEERGKLFSEYWDEFKDPAAIPADASRFEQSVSEGALKYEHSFYNMIHRDELLRTLLSWQIENVGVAFAPDGKAKFRVRGIRGSGDFNTGLGNNLLSAAMAYCCMEDLGITKYRVAMDGDDLVFIIERHDLEKMSKAKCWYDELGFRMKFENPVFELEHVDFCQCRPVRVDGKYIMVRHYRRALAKDAICRKPLSSKKLYQKWLAAVGSGGVAMNGGVPVMQAYYQCFLRASGGAKPLLGDPVMRDWEHKVKNMNREVQEIKPDTRCSYWKATGITPCEQLCIEKYYDNLELKFGEEGRLLLDYPVLPF